MLLCSFWQSHDKSCCLNHFTYQFLFSHGYSTNILFCYSKIWVLFFLPFLCELKIVSKNCVMSLCWCGKYNVMLEDHMVAQAFKLLEVYDGAHGTDVVGPSWESNLPLKHTDIRLLHRTVLYWDCSAHLVGCGKYTLFESEIIHSELISKYLMLLKKGFFCDYVF